MMIVKIDLIFLHSNYAYYYFLMIFIELKFCYILICFMSKKYIRKKKLIKDIKNYKIYVLYYNSYGYSVIFRNKFLKRIFEIKKKKLFIPDCMNKLFT